MPVTGVRNSFQPGGILCTEVYIFGYCAVRLGVVITAWHWLPSLLPQLITGVHHYPRPFGSVLSIRTSTRMTRRVIVTPAMGLGLLWDFLCFVVYLPLLSTVLVPQNSPESVGRFALTFSRSPEPPSPHHSQATYPNQSPPLTFPPHQVVVFRARLPNPSARWGQSRSKLRRSHWIKFSGPG